MGRDGRQYVVPAATIRISTAGPSTMRYYTPLAPVLAKAYKLPAVKRA